MLTRRRMLQISAGLLASPTSALTATGALPLIQRAIPSTGERIPVIGMGSSRTFDVDNQSDSMTRLRAVMQTFFKAQGSVIDSSPMYGEAESRIGDVLRTMQPTPKVFAATKVWTNGREQGIAQMQRSAERMNVKRFDLIAVHNLKDWKTHLKTLKAWKAEGIIRYIGITTSHGRYHDDLADIMRHHPIDFVQFSYNIDNLDAEKVLLPLAQDRGIATMINRPYQRGQLFSASRGKTLPTLASDIGCTSWGQFFLKFILANPAVSCIIPATSKTKHMIDNMGANFGPVPDQQQRHEMLKLFATL